MSALLPADKVAGINGATHWCRAVSRFPFIVIFISVGVRSCNCQHLGLLRWWPPKKNIHLYLDCRKKESWKWSKWSNGANRWLSILLYSPFRCYWEKKFPLWLTFVKQSKFGVFPRKVNGETLGPGKKKILHCSAWWPRRHRRQQGCCSSVRYWLRLPSVHV